MGLYRDKMAQNSLEPLFWAFQRVQEHLWKKSFLTTFGPTVGHPWHVHHAHYTPTNGVLAAWKHLAKDPLHHYLSPQRCPMQSMALKHSTRRWNLKKYAKRVFSRLILRYFVTKRGG